MRRFEARVARIERMDSVRQLTDYEQSVKKIVDQIRSANHEETLDNLKERFMTNPFFKNELATFLNAIERRRREIHR